MPLIKQTKKTGIKNQEHKSETQTERKWLRKNQQSSTEVQSYRQNNQPRGWHGWHHLVHKPGSVDTKHQSPWAGDRAERGDPKWTRVSSLMNKELACPLPLSTSGRAGEAEHEAAFFLRSASSGQSARAASLLYPLFSLFQPVGG